MMLEQAKQCLLNILKILSIVSRMLNGFTLRNVNGDIKHSLADISKIKKDLNWEPTVSIVEGLKKCFNKELRNES